MPSDQMVDQRFSIEMELVQLRQQIFQGFRCCDQILADQGNPLPLVFVPMLLQPEELWTAVDIEQVAFADARRTQDAPEVRTGRQLIARSLQEVSGFKDPPLFHES